MGTCGVIWRLDHVQDRDISNSGIPSNQIMIGCLGVAKGPGRGPDHIAGLEAALTVVLSHPSLVASELSIPSNGWKLAVPRG